MADKESILQLGIEAARAGDKEEARKLFRLLTRETPSDPQAWLWLAGVAEDREEKRAALEKVTELDPSNELARQGLEALGGPTAKPAVQTPPPAPEPAPVFVEPATTTAFDDFDVDWGQPSPRAVEQTPAPAAKADPARTRELTPDEEFAMSLDSLGSYSNAMSDRQKSGNDSSVDFDIPDFGDDLDLDAYMNRERVDVSQIEVKPEEAKKPIRRSPTLSAATAESNNVTPRGGKRKTNQGNSALIRAVVGVLLLFLLGFLAWKFIFSGDPEPVANLNTPQPTSIGGGVTEPVSPTVDLALATPIVEPTIDPNLPQPTPVPPIVDPNTFPVDQQLGSAQPALLPSDGTIPLNVDGWFFNYAGGNLVADGNAINLQPQGRWIAVRLLMADTAGGRNIPADLVVLKDAQGRVYRANLDASEAVTNVYPDFVNRGFPYINQKQTAPAGNFTTALVFDVAPDATDLVLFSPQYLDQGYYVRANSQ
ncbi:tetratricopeptide repeat protein [Herpetosiphon geysericola]|uniref:tetratricopeptide repeat protein n=1 Tax=Herpetosiphon geysericola TaxID=70996 RepID=UPI0006C8FD2A|nr:tetratricopeptide repeat protein [Herpetosiphon geysericola]